MVHEDFLNFCSFHIFLIYFSYTYLLLAAHKHFGHFYGMGSPFYTCNHAF